MAKPRAFTVQLDMKEVARRYYELGHSLEKIGRELGKSEARPEGVTGMTVRRHMMRHDMDTRDASGFNTERARQAALARWGNKEFKRDTVLKLGKDNPEWTIAKVAREADVSYSWAWSTLRAGRVEVAEGKPERQTEESDSA